MKLLDTNILIDCPKILLEDDVAITVRCLEELDGLKRKADENLKKKVVRAQKYIEDNINKIHFISKTYRNLSVDDELIKIATKFKMDILSNDINVNIKAKEKGIHVEKLFQKDEIYSGVIYLLRDFDENGYNEEVEKILNTKKPPFNMHENEFLVIKNTNKEILLNSGEKDFEEYCSFVYTGGKLELLKTNFIKNPYTKITPRNVEQKCLFEALNNKSISILFASGTFGTGKSFCLINYALQELEKGNISKIVYVPNNSFNENTREIGALPGDLVEKELIHMGTLIDITSQYSVEEMIRQEKLEIVPVSIARGRNFNNSIIIVNEAQNLTIDHVKLLIARCGEGSRIFFDGDIKQADSKVFRNKSGVKLLTELRKSPTFGKIFSTVKLRSIERSLTAQAAAFLDEF